MFKFKKSKKKQLADLRFRIYAIRSGFEVQKPIAIHLAEAYEKSPEEFAKTIDSTYTYIIDKLKTLEEVF
jgi:hypothetical protein